MGSPLLLNTAPLDFSELPLDLFGELRRRLAHRSEASE